MTRFCANCGTEVDDTAVFCPTCGQPIDEGREPEIPAAPAWPDPAATDVPPAEAASEEAEAGPRRDDGPGEPVRAEERDEGPPPAAAAAARDERAVDAPTRVEPRAEQRREPEDRARVAEGRDVAPPREATGQRSDERSGPAIDVPLTPPVTLSGWLIGIGAVLAAVGLIVILVGGVLNVIDLLLLLGLVAVAATVFFSASLPAVPNLRLITLVVVLIAFGVALDRVGFRGGGPGELLLFLGSAAAAIGAIVLESGHDQPLGGRQR